GRGPGVVTNTPVVRLESSVLDFGPVQELTSTQAALPVSNLGRAPLHVTASLESGSADFALDTTALEVPVSGTADLLVTFSPLGRGSDEATVLLSTDDPEQPEVRATLRGGPIAPALAFDPDPLDFRPTSQPLVTRPAALKNVGLSTLTVNAVGVDVTGNPDFSVTPPALPLSLRPGETRAVDIAYARSPRAEDGRLEAHSDDEDASVRYLSLLPDPPAACVDGLDNDSDGLIDFPDDPGCLDVADQDELNPPQCINGASQPCGTTVGICRPGVRVCTNSIWGGCDGGVRPAVESCNGADDDCNGVSDDGISEVCTVFGCSGARACLADAGVDGGQWTPCFPVGAVPEQCDGLDNDCNGQADEGVVRACTAFTCAGLQVCIPDAGGTFTSCVPTNPLTETCNGADDDCDGVADDGLLDLVCGVGQCRRTAAACVNGDAGTCTPGTPETEVCNGADDDCNGINDDGLSALSCGVGQCRRTVAACVLGDAGVCAPGAPVAETCNTFDDDCNGTADDGLGTLSCGVGQCARTVAACVGGAAGTCIPGTPVSEACNRLDDDCNGTLDDNIPDLTCGVGQCRRTAAACLNGDAGTCTPGAPTAEACNNLDDDCNGVTDSFTRTCYSGAPTTRGIGRCADGTQTCSAGGWSVPCVGEVLPIAENCSNSVDDDCDGTVNNGCSGCNPNGLYTLDAGTISYGCCLGLVNLNINQFQFLSNGATVTPGPTGPGNLSGAATTCPSGSFNNVISLPGGCTETYRLTGSFVGPNTWVGTFTATFTGSQCGCFGVDSCTNQTWSISAGR
ncbi:MAG: hypothetical protein IT380_21730, partial [Myxococcales bacterium]|nr:hypothetical protein [Myxococcales bacterium]